MCFEASDLQCGKNLLNLLLVFVLKVPRKQAVEKPSRAVEREAMEMERKNRLYTLVDSDSDEDVGRDSRKERKKDREKKRKHIRQKQESESSSDNEAPKR